MIKRLSKLKGILPTSQKGFLERHYQGRLSDLNNRKKLVLVLMLTFGVVFSASAVKLQIWMTGETPERLQILTDLMESDLTPRTGITAEFTPLPWTDSDHKFLLAAASGETPDLAMTAVLLPAEMGIRGAAVDLKKAFGTEFDKVASVHFPNTFTSYTFQNAVFAVPYRVESNPMIVRYDILQNLGFSVPKTWDELRTMLPKLQANQMNFTQTFGIGEESFRPFSMFVWQNGGRFFNDDLTASAWDEPEAIKGFTELVELYTKYKIPVEDVPIETFRRGEAPIMLLPWWTYGSFQQGLPELAGKWGIELVPGTMRNGKLDQTSWFGGTPLIIFNKSKHQKEAWEWIKWVTQPEIQGELAKRTIEKIPGSLLLPSVPEAYNMLPLPEKHREVFRDQAKASKAPVFTVASERIINRYIQFALNEAVVQGVSPDVAIKKAAQGVNMDLKTKWAEWKRFISKL